jgi:hypothetical protein
MAGTQKKSDTAEDKESRPLEDAPKLPDEVQPKTSKADAQAQPMDEQDTPVTKMSDVTVDYDDDLKLVVAVDMAGVPKAEDVKVKEGEHDPSLVHIPGLGSFRNGTTTKVTAEQLFLFTQHLQVTGVLEGQLPPGITVKKEGDK